MKPRGDWGGNNDRSRDKTAMLRRLGYIYKEVLDFCFMLNLHGIFLHPFFFFLHPDF